MPPFRLQRDTQVTKEILHLYGWKTGDGTGEKLAVPGHIGQNFLWGTVVGQIASTFPGDVELPPHLLIALQEDDRYSQLGSSQRRKHARGASPYDNDTLFFLRQISSLPLLVHIRRRPTKSSPVWRKSVPHRRSFAFPLQR